MLSMKNSKQFNSSLINFAPRQSRCHILLKKQIFEELKNHCASTKNEKNSLKIGPIRTCQVAVRRKILLKKINLLFEPMNLSRSDFKFPNHYLTFSVHAISRIQYY